jgi:hypothetical protein
MDGPLLDLSDPAVSRMIKLAKRRGYITYDELDIVLPPDEFSAEQIDDVLSQLSELGIDVVETHEGIAAIYRALARELRSFAVGQRGQGRELLENSARALATKADEVWVAYDRGSWSEQEAGRFLVFDAKHGVTIAEREPCGEWIGQDGQRLAQVTHWRPLPQPPPT